MESKANEVAAKEGEGESGGWWDVVQSFATLAAGQVFGDTKLGKFGEAVAAPFGVINGALETGRGIAHGDAYETMHGASETVADGATIAELLGVGGEAAELLGPLGAAFGAGAELGHQVDKWASPYVKEHDFYDGMTADQHATSEGQKVDTGGVAGRVAGASRAVEVKLEDDALAVGNATGLGIPAGLGDAVVGRKKDAHAARAVQAIANSVPASVETPEMRSSSTAHEMSTEDQIKVWAYERNLRQITQGLQDEANGEIQMPAMDMRRGHK